jgi:predicted PurR-regulated permease PerM
MIGMIGGLLVFGIPGLIIGPLILAYFLTFLKAYKERTLSSLFSSE